MYIRLFKGGPLESSLKINLVNKIILKKYLLVQINCQESKAKTQLFSTILGVPGNVVKRERNLIVSFTDKKRVPETSLTM